MFTLLINGIDKTDLIKSHLKRITLTDNDGLDSDELMIELNDKDVNFSLPPTGAKLLFAIGNNTLISKGIYVVDEITNTGPPNVISIAAKAADMTQDLKAKNDRNWNTITLGTLVNSIASKYSLQTAISDEHSALEVENLIQTNESDMHLLTRVSEALGLQCKYAHGVLAVTQKNASKSLSGLPLPIFTLSIKDTASYSMTRADRDAFKGVKTFYLDTDNGKRKKVTTGDAPYLYIPTLQTNESDALKLCNSEMQTLTKGAVTGSVKSAILDARITPGCKLQLEGFNDGLNGIWLVNSCVHTIDTKGRSVRVDFGYYSTN